MTARSKSIARIIPLSLMIAASSCFAFGYQAGSDSVKFICGELLGRPTGTSITVNLCADRDIDAYVEYGTVSNQYPQQTSPASCMRNVPFNVILSGLNPNTRYYYRVRYRISGSTEFLALGEHTFHTARPRGSTFSFAIEADAHMDASTHPELLKRTLTNILSSHSDFLIDLGDNFMSDKIAGVTRDSVVARHLLLHTFYDVACHSVPLTLVIGNHEGELGWLLNGTPDNLPVWASNTRKMYYPNPSPDGFYSGDTTSFNFIGRRQNYYAWEWGNALFVALDPYWYTTRKPGSSKDNWDWTLGKTQYDWLKNLLANSRADFKFVFAHQIVGGIDTEGRGGIEGVPFYEMGGLNADGTPGFAAHRPGWDMPIHQLMVKYRVSAFFHGHDHVFVKQDLDGMVYQELPQPGYYNFSNPANSYSNTGLATKYGYSNGVVYSSSGYLRVTVSDTTAVVNYVRSYLPADENAQRQNGTVAYSYTIRKGTPTTSVQQAEHEENGFELSQNYPNPFNPSTTIQYRLSENASVRLRVHDVLGREVATLVDEEQQSGSHTSLWNASDVPSGLYFIRLEAGNSASVRKALLVK